MEVQQKILSKNRLKNFQDEEKCIKENLDLSKDKEINQNVRIEKEYLNMLKRARNTLYTKALFGGDSQSDTDKLIVEKVQSDFSKYIEQGPLIGILSHCQISGCKVHCIDKNGNIVSHFSEYGACSNIQIEMIENMNERLKLGYKVFKEHKECYCVEVYEKKICLISASGQVEIINK